MSQNPYEKIYDSLNITISQDTTFQQAEKIATQLGYIYNTFGVIVKDLINILGYKFKGPSSQKIDNQNQNRKKISEEGLPLNKTNKNKEQLNPNKQHLEGKNKITPPNRITKQIQSNKPSQHKNYAFNDQILREKLLKLKQTRAAQPAHQKERINNLSNQVPQTDHSNPIVKQDLNAGSRKISMRRKRDVVLINISSEDEFKMENGSSESHHIKTRAQLRGHQNPYKDHQNKSKYIQNVNSPRKRGRPGRKRIHFNQKSSSKNSGSVDKSVNKTLNPNDPFSIVYNVPYKGSETKSSQKIRISQMVQSKKQQKLQKSIEKEKMMSNQQDERSNFSLDESQKIGKSTPKIDFKSQSFKNKVMMSFEAQKKIKERIQNMQKQYQNQILYNSKQVINGQKLSSDQISQNQQFDDQQSYDEEYDEVNQNSEEPYEKQRQAQYDPEDYLIDKKINRIPYPQDYQDNEEENENEFEQNEQIKQNFMNRINEQIQKQFQQNFRMNEQLNEDKFSDNFVSQNLVQNGQYQQELALDQVRQNAQLSKNRELRQQKDQLANSENNHSFDSYEKVVFDNFSQNQNEQNCTQKNNLTQSNIIHENHEKQSEFNIISALDEYTYNQNTQNNLMQKTVNLTQIKQNVKQFKSKSIDNQNKEAVLRVLQEFESSVEQQKNNIQFIEMPEENEKNQSILAYKQMDLMKENEQSKQNQLIYGLQDRQKIDKQREVNQTLPKQINSHYFKVNNASNNNLNDINYPQQSQNQLQKIVSNSGQNLTQLHQFMMKKPKQIEVIEIEED